MNGLDPEAYLRDLIGRIADQPINRESKAAFFSAARRPRVAPHRGLRPPMAGAQIPCAGPEARDRPKPGTALRSEFETARTDRPRWVSGAERKETPPRRRIEARQVAKTARKSRFASLSHQASPTIRGGPYNRDPPRPANKCYGSDIRSCRSFGRETRSLRRANYLPARTPDNRRRAPDGR